MTSPQIPVILGLEVRDRVVREIQNRRRIQDAMAGFVDKKGQVPRNVGGLSC